ncbi:alpha-amylase family glycosyl hydrolase [Sporosarcina sp. CAU 1771]
MKINRSFAFILSLALFLSILQPMGASAIEDRTLEDESIYELLVDRYDDGDESNNENVDTQNFSLFSGGDYAGIINRIDYIADLGFTMMSLGSIFKTEAYDGSRVEDYEKLEPHFGSEEDLSKMIEVAHEKKIGVLADFPFGGVSENHEWAKEGLFKGTPVGEGRIDWDSSDALVKEALKNAVVAFAEGYNLDGLRLTNLNDFDTEYVNEVIAAVKKVKPEMYVFSTEVTESNFDAMPNVEKINALKQSFVAFNPDSSPLDLFKDEQENGFIQFDSLTEPRFTYEMREAGMFPPTRWKLAVAALFTLPGVPVMTYGTEIAVNGKEAPESHPLSNFKTDMELYDYISDLNKLRNQSEALRKGDFELLHNEGGFVVYKISDENETWIVTLNNTTETANFEIPATMLGENKMLRGVVDGDRVRESKDGIFRIVVERELAEIYFVDEDRGFNTPYLIASILVYVFFLSFLFVVLRRGKKARQASTK